MCKSHLIITAAPTDRNTETSRVEYERLQSQRGDADAAFATAPVKVDQTYVTPAEMIVLATRLTAAGEPAVLGTALLGGGEVAAVLQRLDPPNASATPGTRRVVLRICFALGRDGGLTVYRTFDSGGQTFA